MGASLLDGDGPLVAGDIPVELVVVVEEAEGVGDDVLDGNGARAVVGVGNIDFQFEVLALAAGFEFQWTAVFVGDALDVEEKGVVQAARAGVFDGNMCGRCRARGRR